MKAALLIAGYLRSFKTNISNIKELILNSFDSVDIYLHITKNENEEDKYLNIVEEEDYSFIEKELNPVCLIKEPNIYFYKNRFKNSTYNTWLKFFKLNQIKQINEKNNGKYDIVIKTRPDLHLLKTNFLKHRLDQNTIYLPTETVVDSHKLRKKTDPTLCDIFAYGTSESMDVYFDLYSNLNTLSKKHGNVSETLLYFYLNSNQNICYKQRDIKYSVILSQCNTFAICGDSGSGKSTLSKLLKNNFSNAFTLEGDRYHKWERDNHNWNTSTHLHPESNYITKMSSDIFDLKIGKTIYQVDYDHNTGKFTNKQEIKHSDNIIVCGLHSLYAPNHIYNLKIFMDTDDKLKTAWKIKRDTKERGYTAQQVIQNIKKRKTDYKKYILPQKNNANLIVRFFPINDDVDNVGLELLVSKKFSINPFHKDLNNNDIKYTFQILENMFSFTFLNFKKIKEPKFLTSNSLYDYILLFILKCGFSN